MKISNFALFRNLSEKEVENITRHARVFKFQQGSTVISRGAYIDFVYFIRSGRVKESTYTRAGKEVVFNMLSVGDCFGLVSPFSNETSNSEFVASTDCEVFAISVTQFLSLMGTNSSFTQSIVSEIARVSTVLSEKLYEIRAFDVAARTQAELLRHASGAPDEINSKYVEIENLPTHEEIANTIFTHREAVTKEISKLRKSGVIIKTARNKLAADIDMLQNMVGVA